MRVLIMVVTLVAAPSFARAECTSGCEQASCRCGCANAQGGTPCPLAAPPLADENAVTPLTPMQLEELEIQHEAKQGLAIGLVLITTGVALAATHALSTSGPGRLYDFVPVTGPIVDVIGSNPGAGWNGGLLFAAWLEAAGIVVTAVSASYLRAVPSQNEVSIAPDVGTNHAGLSLSGKF